MRRGCVWLVVLLVALAVAGPAQASTFQLSAAGRAPDVAVDAAGTGYFVFNQPGATVADNDVTQFCRVPRGGGACEVLKPLVPPEPSSNQEKATPQVLVSGSDVYVVTTRGSNDSVWLFHSADRGTTWDAGSKLGEDGYNPLKEAILGPGGALSWISPGGLFRTAALPSGSAGAAVDVFPASTQSGATLGLADTSTALAVAADDNGKLYVSKRSGAGWSAPAEVAPGGSPQLVWGPGGAWLFSRPSGSPVEARHWDGAAFGAPASVTGAQPVGSESAFAEDAAGGLHGVYRWIGEGGTQGGAVYTYSADGKTWSPLEQLADRSVDVFHPRIAATAHKDGFAVWDSNGTGKVLAAALGTATASPPPDTASTCPTVSFRPVEAISVDGCWTADGDAFVAPGKVKVNGLEIDPKAGSQVVVNPKARTIATRGGPGAFVHAGLMPIDAGPVSWSVPDASDVHVLDGDTGSLGGDLFGLKVAGTSSVSFQPGETTIALHVHLPDLFGDVTGDASLKADNASGLRIDGIDVQIKDALIGPLEVKNLALHYLAAGAVWDGTADLILPPRPPGAELLATFGLKGGAFDHATGAFTFPAPGVAMAPNVFLKEIHFALTTHPTKIAGGLQITAGPTVLGSAAVEIDGDMSYTFADPPKPAVLEAHGVGKIANVPMADAALEYRSSGLFKFGAHLDYTFFDLLHLKAGIDGFVDTSANTFMVEGGGHLTCPIFLLCPLDVDAIVSSRGIAACGSAHVLGIPVDLGFGYKWGEGFQLFLLAGCDLDGYRVQASAAQAGGTRHVRLRAGRFAMVGVAGAGGPPGVSLRRGGHAVRAKAITDAHNGVTYLFVPHPRAGTYDLVSAAGSPAITKVAVAAGLPAPSVRGSVSGHGARRVLRYRLRPIAGQKVTFTEEAGHVARRLGAARGARGTLRFAPGYGPKGRRTIYALVEQRGRPRARIRVARYTAPAPKGPAAPRGLKATRAGRSVTVTWKRVRGVRLYRVQTRLTDGRRSVQLLTKAKLVLGDVAPEATGTVSVAAALPDLRTGRAAKVKVLKLGAKPPKPRRPRRKA